MSAIDDIRKQVVQHLLERHYQAKERGDELFFTVEITDPYSVPYFLRPRVTAKATLKISFYGNRERQQIAYLVIADNRQVFLVIDFDARNRHEMSEAVDQLKYYFFNSNHLQGIRGIHGQSSPQQVEYIIELIQPTDMLGKVDRFLDEIKPEVDKSVEGLLRSSQFKFLFLTKAQFDTYIQSEPAYTPSESIKKVGLALASVRITNFRRIKSVEINDLPASARWIVLTGENGFGKTSVLQAIGVVGFWRTVALLVFRDIIKLKLSWTPVADT